MTDSAIERSGNLVDKREFWRYLLISGIALEVDVVVLMLLTDLLAAHYLAANAVAFTAGSIVAYVGSVRWAFSRRRFTGPLEYLLFVLIGVCALGVNELVLWVGVAGLAFPVLVAKAGAAAGSFLFNFIVRKMLLFS